jgi:hypothetical protein
VSFAAFAKGRFARVRQAAAGWSAIIGSTLGCHFTSVRKWWNWQTHHLEGVAPKGVGVQIPPSAPILRAVYLNGYEAFVNPAQ